MLDKLKKTVSATGEVLKGQATQLADSVKEQAAQLTESVKEQASHLTESVKEKTNSLIEDWVLIFPTLESYGLRITAFGMKMAISPALECELRGEAEDFSIEKLTGFIEAAKGNSPLTLVLKTIRMTYDWHSRTGSEQHFDKIYVKISVQLTPEVMVYLGEPKLL
jgi:hypothetical protein